MTTCSTFGFIVSVLAASAWAAPVICPDGAWREGYPPRIGDTVSADPEFFQAHGYREATAEEIAAKAQAEVDAQAEAEAQAALYADPQPSVFVPRFSGSLTNIVGMSKVLVDDSDDSPVFVDETGSPEHTLAQKQAQADAKAARKAAKAEARRALDDAKNVADLKALLAVWMDAQ